MTVTVSHITVPGAAQPYTALLDAEGLLVRYTSVVEPDQHFDVLHVPYTGEAQWLGSWGWLWSPDTRQRLEAAAVGLIRRV